MAEEAPRRDLGAAGVGEGESGDELFHRSVEVDTDGDRSRGGQHLGDRPDLEQGVPVGPCHRSLRDPSADNEADGAGVEAPVAVGRLQGGRDRVCRCVQASLLNRVAVTVDVIVGNRTASSDSGCKRFGAGVATPSLQSLDAGLQPRPANASRARSTSSVVL